MALVNKPDESIFASSAKQGEVDNFPDLLRGWGISFEQTGGIPPMEWFNFLFKRLDEKHTYLMQRGLPEWSATQDYPAGAFVQYQGLSYKALRTNKNSPPSASNSADWQRWGFTLTEIAKASLTQQGIVQLTNALNSDAENLALTAKAGKALAQQTVQAKQEIIRDYIPNTKKSAAVNSTSTDMVATSAAVKTAYDKGVEAKNAADGAQRTADNANNNANNRVSKSGDTMTGFLNLNRADALLRLQRNGVDKSAIGFRNEASEDLLLYNYAFNTEFALRQHDLYCNKPLNLPGVVFENNDFAGFNIKNGSGRYVRVEGNPHSNSMMMTFVYREASGANIHAVFLPKKNGTILLDSDISHATNGTAKNKVASEFALGELNKTKANLADFSYQKIGNFEIRKYPDGTMIQTYAVEIANKNTQKWSEHFNWAVAFASKPTVIPILAGITDDTNATDTYILYNKTLSSNTKCVYHTHEYSWHGTKLLAEFTAIGRWK